MRSISILVLLAISLPLGVGSAAAPGGAVDVANYSFKDTTTRTVVTPIATGQSVTWTWVSGVHTVTADDGSFASGQLGAGQTFTVTFTGAGVHTYHCSIHGSMNGIVVVT